MAPRIESKYCGVSYKPLLSKYEAAINNHGKKLHLGFFDEPVDAARARDRAAIALHGDNVRQLNFPLESYRDESEAQPHIRNQFSLASTLRLWPSLRDSYTPDEAEDGQQAFNVQNYSVAVWNVSTGAVSTGLVTA